MQGSLIGVIYKIDLVKRIHLNVDHPEYINPAKKHKQTDHIWHICKTSYQMYIGGAFHSCAIEPED